MKNLKKLQELCTEYNQNKNIESVEFSLTAS